MEEDASQSVGCRRDCLGRAEMSAHATVEVTEGALAVMQRLGGHAQRECGAALHLACSDENHLAPGDIVIRAQSHPRCECRGAGELGEVWTDLAEQRLSDAGVDAGNFGEVNAPDPL